MESNESEIVAKSYISVPIEILEYANMANRARMTVLIHICAAKLKVLDADQISSITGLSKEDVDDAILFWRNVGVIRNKNLDVDDIVKEKLRKILKRAPMPFEVSMIVDAYNKCKIDNEDVLSGALELCYSRQRTDLEWAVKIIQQCAASSNPMETLEIFYRYYSLTEKICEGFPIERKLTSKEKKIILEWANAKIPLSVIFDSYTLSLEYTKTISLPYIDTLVQRQMNNPLFINTGDIGY